MSGPGAKVSNIDANKKEKSSSIIIEFKVQYFFQIKGFLLSLLKIITE
jgi:hypothetical protein